MTTQVEPPGARSGTRNYVLFLLLMLTILSFVDRQVLTILLDPIKHELALTDTQLGALTGVFFSLFYAAAGLPLARLADGREKRSFIAACIAGWSIATVFTGLAMNFVQLAISRTLVAVGEAGCAPATASLIGDLFPPNRRARVFSAMSAASAVGLGGGIFLGGSLSEHFGWRSVFLFLGIPGAALALLFLFTLPRGDALMVKVKPPPMLETMKSFWRIRCYRVGIIVTLTAGTGAYGMLGWMATLLIRTHHLPRSQVGLYLGISMVTGLLIGNAVCGQVTDRLAARDSRWLLRVMGFSLFGVIPLALCAFFAKDVTVSLVAFCLTMISLGFWSPIMSTMVIGLVPRETRAVSASFNGIFQSLGAASGPLVVGFLTDRLTPALGADAIRYSLALSMIFTGIGATTALIGTRFIQAEYRPNGTDGGEAAAAI